MFPLSSIAWSTAASTGALGYMEYAEVRRFTRVYVLQEQFMAMQQETLGKWLDLQKWSAQLVHVRDLSRFTTAELSEIEDAAAAALTRTATEADIARALIEEDAKALETTQHGP